MDTRKRTVSAIQIDGGNYKKDRTVCKHCCNRRKRNIFNIIDQERRINDNNASVST